MHIKKCSKCNRQLLLADFYQRRKGSRAGKYYEKCIACMKERGVKYYHDNHDRQLKLAILRRNKNRLKMIKYMNNIKSKPCMDCGSTYPPYVMDFDHKDGSIKSGNVSRMSNGGWSKIKVDSEIEKCDLVCSNCHRIRTFKRNNKNLVNYN